jgi:hypothetical protein
MAGVPTGPEGLQNLKSYTVQMGSSIPAPIQKKLEQLDSNRDGVITAADLSTALDQWAADRRDARLFKWIAIACAVLFVLLVAALTGMTYGMVSLIRNTNVENRKFLVDKVSGEPIVTGGTMLDVSSVKYNSTSSASRRRLLADDGNVGLTYGTLLVDVSGLRLLDFPLVLSAHPLPTIGSDTRDTSASPPSTGAQECRGGRVQLALRWPRYPQPPRDHQRHHDYHYPGSPRDLWLR